MKLQIKTTKLQDMLAKAIKGASNNKLIPLTGLIAIEVSNGELTLTTTDATNYFYVKEREVAGEDFYVAVQTDTFAKLIARMTCDTITLELANSSLTVVGNGSYKIDIPLDEDGNPVKFPNPASNFPKISQIGDLSVNTIKRIVNGVKQALLTTTDYPWYTCYYVGSSVIATDTFKVSALNENVFEQPKLISAELMNLLDVITDEHIKVYADDNRLLFESEHYTVYGVEPEGIDEFAVSAINGLIEQKFVSSCKVSKSAILGMLDRISLFVGAYDNGEVNMTFTKDGIVVSSKLSTGTELLPYVESNNFSDFVCGANINMLTQQIKAQSSDVIAIWYGEDNAIKIVDGDMVSIVALLTE